MQLRLKHTRTSSISPEGRVTAGKATDVAPLPGGHFDNPSIRTRLDWTADWRGLDVNVVRVR